MTTAIEAPTRSGSRRVATAPGGVGVAARRVGITTLRLAATAPVICMLPELASSALGRPHGTANVVTSANDVLGTGGLLLFLLMLTVTPLTTVLGWRWHRVLRRDFGRAMFVAAGLDLVIAATMSGSRFPGGLMARVGGHGFLLSGTLSSFLVVPLMATSNRAAQRWLGRHWQLLHRLVYVAWVTILIHLAFLFAFRTLFIDMLIVSGPLALLRVGRLERWWVASRRGHRRRALRSLGGLVLLGVYLVGMVPLFIEFAHVGVGALTQHPPQ